MMASAPAAWLLLIIPAAPLLIVCGLMLWPRRRLLSRLASWAALPALACAIALPVPAGLDLPWILLGTELGIDRTSRVFLFFTALLWLAAGIFATGYLDDDPRRTRFFVFFLFAMAGNLGLVIAQDMLSFYASFAMMSFASYGLIAHTGTAEARRAGRIYIIMVLAGEVMLFAALVLAAQAAGSTLFDEARASLVDAPARDAILALALGGFGIKLGALGLHVWLPLAHPVAPTPASAVLSGAMIKAGLLGWLNLLPLGEGAVPVSWSALLIVAGLLAAFYAAIIGVTQRDPKTVLAYSSVSQMGLATIAVGLGLAVPSRWPEILAIIVFFALNHALAKGALFLGVGVAASRLAAGRRKWLVATGLVLPALALAGAPFTGGALVKEALGAEAAFIAAPWSGWLKTLLSLTVFATVFLMARFLYLTWPRNAPDIQDAPPGTYGMALPWSALILVLLIAPVHAGLDTAWTMPAILSNVATLGLAVAMAIVGGWIMQKTGLTRLPRPPAGDLVVPVEMAINAMRDLVTTIARGLQRQRDQTATTAKGRLAALILSAAPNGGARAGWVSACLMFLALLIVTAALSAL